ncbi:hypothetical protein UlMin_025324 [Ulmus minor]
MLTANDVAVAFVRKRVCRWRSGVLDGEHMHMRCCAHIVNLIVSDRLKELGESISAIRNVVRYIRFSPARLQKFKLCSQKAKIEYNGLLVLDVPTRWNSTYMMLNVAIKFQQVFERFEEEDDKYLPFFHEEDGPPTSIDWENAKVFVKFLHNFYNATLKCSATLSVTSNIYYHNICEIQSQLTEMWSSGDILLSKMVYCFACLYDVDTTASLSNKVIKTLTDLYAFYCMGKGKPTMNLGSGIYNVSMKTIQIGQNEG